MPVEIAILSGAQQGGRWATEAGRVVVGDASACDICFDADLDAGARGKQGVLSLRDDGWRFENQGSGSWLVNQTTVTPGRDCRLRSGDIVRMSEDGPDLRFTMLTAREYATSIGNPVPEGDKMVAASAGSLLQRAQTVDLPSPPTLVHSRVTRFAGIVVAVLLLVGFVFGLGVWPTCDAPPVAVTDSGKTEPETPDKSAGSENEPDADGQTAVVENEGDAGGDSMTDVEPEPPRTGDPAPLDPDEVSASEPGSIPDAGAIQTQVADAVVYLMVEINGQKFPVCCGWAVTPDLIVSTGGPIAVLAEMLEKGQPVFAAYGDRNPRFIAVDALIVHPLFDKDQTNLPVSRAHNVGVATLKAALPKHCDLEQASALPRPPTGMTLTVVAYAVTTEPDLVPFNVLDPPRLQSMSVRVAGVETLSGATNDLPLLRLEGDAPSGMEGSPVFTSEGKVIGVLGGTAANRHAILCDQLEPLLP